MSIPDQGHLPAPVCERRVNHDSWRFTLLHFVCCLLLFVWYYRYVPVAKANLDHAQLDATPSIYLVTSQSDVIVNYWYLLAPASVVLMAVDYRVMRWIGRELGTRRISYVGFSITICVLLTLAYGQYVIS